jgi:hypothetical protein
MNRLVSLLGPVCALVLLLYCFRAVLFGGAQFAYRDAAHFYYPLYRHVQNEWNAGRWPLWDPAQNAGVPLLGMPMAAVLYPGKLLFALLPYPWATRLYTLAHVALAWAGMLALARAWRLSHTAASIAALAYAFGAPVLFQYCNIIYLVGAAWLPWGFLTLELLLHRKRRIGLLGLAAVLALQVLGGDPEAAYLTVLCGGGYALVLAAWAPGSAPALTRPLGEASAPGSVAALTRPSATISQGERVRWWWAATALALVVWVAVTLVAAYAAPQRALPGPALRIVAWGLAALAVVWRWRRCPRQSELGPMLASLTAGAALALLLAAVQLVPIVEYAGNTVRAADTQPDRIYGFCVEPYCIIEMVWPGAFGRFGPENRSWIQAIPPAGERQIWTPSLYLGGLTLVLALGGFGFRGGPAWRPWLSLVALVALAASFGKFGGPLWIVRWVPGVPALLGRHDPARGVERVDGFFHDGAGSVYGLLAAVLPGFDLFRYPGKLSTFAAAALAVLAGAGWDRLAAGQSRTPRHGSRTTLIATLLALGLVMAARGPLLSWLRAQLPPDIEFGPVNPQRALDATIASLVHGGLVFALGLGLTTVAPRHPQWAGAAALLLMALDLGVANAPLVWTVPQAEFDKPSRAAQEIAAAERAGPSRASSAGAFRVHRMRASYPAGFALRPSPERLREAATWERDTLQPLHALPLHFDYTLIEGILESDDYAQFFASRLVSPRDPNGSVIGPPVYSLPRQGFDLWNTRYFIMTVTVNGWLGGEREFERLYPRDDVVADRRRAQSWIEREDWQLLRNTTAFPRAWLVHFLRVRSPITQRYGIEHARLMDDLVYQADAYWNDPRRGVYDLKMMAFVETDQPERLAGYISRTAVAPTESVTITRYEPQRVELAATLDRPGLVILADVYYPGWKLTIDGEPASIYRTNRMMRGAAVKAGRHTLVYTYEPASFRVGAILSLTGLLAMALLIPWARAVRSQQDLPN